MNRKEALEKFKKDHLEESQHLMQGFWDRINEHAGEILSRIHTAFEDISRQAREKEKSHVTYFTFSLMRCDLLRKRAIVRLDAMGVEWYLDDTTLTTSLDLSFLFEPFFKREEKLLLDMRIYRGKVNRHDVSHMIQEEIFVCNQLITHMLRFSLRNIETIGAFSGIPKLLFWSVRWGEYKDYTEIALRVNREEQSPQRWQEKLKDLEAEEAAAGNHDEGEVLEDSPATQGEIGLAFDYWYNIPLTGGDVSGKTMYFTTFEECTLSGITLRETDLSGSRFINCRIEDCDFTGAILDRSEWSGCSFGENRFPGASFKQAFFSREGFVPELFTKEQTDDILMEVEAV